MNIDFLVFNTEAEANVALETIYSNMVDAIDSPDLLDVATGEVVPKDELTPDEAVQVNAGNRHFPIFSKNAETRQKDTENGHTTAWAIAAQTVDGQWVFKKPIDSLMIGVSNYVVQPFNPDWFPTPIETI